MDFEKQKGVEVVAKEWLFPQEERLSVEKRKNKLSVGVPCENPQSEDRTPLTPQAVDLLVSNGIEVRIENGAGEGALYRTKEYLEYGAKIVDKPTVYKSDVVLKIAPPTLVEIGLLKGEQILISKLSVHAQTKEQIGQLQAKRITAISFEELKDKYDCFPIMRSMSEIAGTLAVNVASNYLGKAEKGKGILLGGVAGVTPSELIILGAGTAGEYAARVALGQGATVKVFDFSTYKLRRLSEHLGQRIFTSVFHPHVLVKNLSSADAVVSAMHFTDNRKRILVTEEMVKKMKPGSVIVDLNIENGGSFETSMPTNIQSPVYTKHDVIHHCVPNITSYVSKTASLALSNIFAPLLLHLAEHSPKQSILADAGIRHGTYLFEGILTHRFLGEKLGVKANDIDLLRMVF